MPEEWRTEPFPTLDALLRMVRERAPELISARGAVGVAEASYAGARLAPFDNPYLETFVDRGTSGVTRDVAVQSNLWLPIELSGQRGRRIQEVDALVDWRRTELDVARSRVSGDAVRAYGAVLVAAARIRTLEEIVAGARAESEVYEQRLAAGDATLQDTKLANLERSRNEVLLEEARSDLTRTLVDLARAAGVSFAVPDGLAPLAPEPPRPRGAAEAMRTAELAPQVLASDREARFHARAAERAASTAHVPVNFILSAGRGDLGEARFGGGLSWTFPVLRKNQGEIARAEAEKSRALAEADIRRRVVARAVMGLDRQRSEVRRARELLDNVAKPAAEDAVAAALAMKQAGKGEMLLVLTARRELALLKLRRLELAAHEWSILGDLVAVTGELR